jgi:hypothetical protein
MFRRRFGTHRATQLRPRESAASHCFVTFAIDVKSNPNLAFPIRQPIWGGGVVGVAMHPMIVSVVQANTQKVLRSRMRLVPTSTMPHAELCGRATVDGQRKLAWGDGLSSDS